MCLRQAVMINHFRGVKKMVFALLLMTGCGYQYTPEDIAAREVHQEMTYKRHSDGDYNVYLDRRSGDCSDFAASYMRKLGGAGLMYLCVLPKGDLHNTVLYKGKWFSSDTSVLQDAPVCDLIEEPDTWAEVLKQVKEDD